MDRYAAFPSLELDRPAPHVLRITLRARGRLNAVSGTMHRELAEVWKEIGADEETRAVGQTKRLLDRAETTTFEQQLELEAATQSELTRTPDFSSGVAAFLEKRKPEWKGR